jgi:hypothetical protein
MPGGTRRHQAAPGGTRRHPGGSQAAPGAGQCSKSANRPGLSHIWLTSVRGPSRDLLTCCNSWLTPLYIHCHCTVGRQHCSLLINESDWSTYTTNSFTDEVVIKQRNVYIKLLSLFQLSRIYNLLYWSIYNQQRRWHFTLGKDILGMSPFRIHTLKYCRACVRDLDLRVFYRREICGFQ